MTKKCIVCKTIFERKEGEANARWRGRKYCSRQCWYKKQWVNKTGGAKISPEKVCAYCGTVFERKGGAIERWLKRKYCSRKCNDIDKRGGTLKRPSKTRVCEQCGESYTKPYTLSWKEWQGRKFCGTSCGYKGRVNRAPRTAFQPGHKPHNYTEEGYTYNAVHKWLNNNYKKSGTCDFCGEQKKTSWANKDGQYKRDRTNFYELCHRCHNKFDGHTPKRPNFKGSVV